MSGSRARRHVCVAERREQALGLRRRTALNQVLACAVAFGMAAAAWAAEGNQTKTPEQKAWEGVNSLDGESLRQFLQQFPDGDRAGDAKVALELQSKMSSIRAGKSKDRIAISLEV